MLHKSGQSFVTVREFLGAGVQTSGAIVGHLLAPDDPGKVR